VLLSTVSILFPSVVTQECRLPSCLCRAPNRYSNVIETKRACLARAGFRPLLLLFFPVRAATRTWRFRLRAQTLVRFVFCCRFSDPKTVLFCLLCLDLFLCEDLPRQWTKYPPSNLFLSRNPAQKRTPCARVVESRERVATGLPCIILFFQAKQGSFFSGMQRSPICVLTFSSPANNFFHSKRSASPGPPFKSVPQAPRVSLLTVFCLPLLLFSLFSEPRTLNPAFLNT